MGILDTIKVALFGTDRVNSAKSECKTKKKSVEDKYKEEMARIENECATSLAKAKELDKQNVGTVPVVTPQPQQPQPQPQLQEQPQEPTQYVSELGEKRETPVYGGKKGGKSKKRSKSNRKKTMRKRR